MRSSNDLKFLVIVINVSSGDGGGGATASNFLAAFSFYVY